MKSTGEPVKQGGTAGNLYPSLAEPYYSVRGGFLLPINPLTPKIQEVSLMFPSLQEIQKLAKTGKYRRIPLCRELYADRFTPIEVMRTLRAASRHCYLLESAENNQTRGRYSFLGYEPTLELTCSRGQLVIRRGDTEHFQDIQHYSVHHPGEAIRGILNRFRSPLLKGMPPFTGGLVGYFSYEYIHYGEPSLAAPYIYDGGEDFRDVDLMLFDKVIVFDHYRQKLLLIVGVETGNPEKSYENACAELNKMEQLLNSGAKALFRPLHLKAPLTPVFSKKEYCQMVEKAKNYIREGDIFQAVLSNPQEAPAEGSLFDAYRVLRTTNPSPYMFYFSSDDIEVAGASPETLVKLTDGVLQTFPLAGTRPRGTTEEEDLQLEQELLADEKELAEHNMLVDLGRNDLGKISRLGTVCVEKYLKIQRFSHVMHIGSQVSGKILSDKDAVDAIDAILPAGTLSGAPKIRACQIIGELERRPRGIYGGAIGYLDFSGNLDTCISIRLAYKKNGKVCVQSGAGIVADSIPEKEFDECCSKARAVINALQEAKGGLS